MKKIILLFASALLGLGAMAQTMEFTFTRGDGNTATVAVPEGVTATMASNVDWNTGGAMAGRTEVLCPNRNTSAASGDNFITYTLTLSGLAQDKVFSAAKFTHIAVNSAGDLQPSNNQDIRHCNFTLSANGAEVASLTDQNIWIAAGQTDRVVTLEGNTFTADAEGNLVLVLKLAKGTNNNGCFYGLTKVELVEMSDEPTPEPEPEPTVVHTFSADKVYYIQWKNTGANYITENRDGSLTVADKKNSKYQFWRLIPVEGKSHCYTVLNVVTENYLGSCNKTPSSSSRVSTSATAVEYYIGATAGSGDIAGCHYFSSTDCENYSDESAGPRALNKDGASSYVITWQAGTSRPGSYWKIVETTEKWQAPEPPAHTEQTKALTVYFRPCGMTYNTWLTAATIGGVAPIAYAATAKPASFHVPYSKARGAVRRGSEFAVSITLSSADDADLKANAYFDWNADGEFETTAPITLDGTAGTATVTVPDDAVSGDTRMRIRLNSNGLDRADDDVEGFVYDLPLTVVDATTGRKVLVDVNGANNGTVALSAAGDSHIVGTSLTATATPKGNATFDSWREGGVVVSRDAEYTFTVEDRNVTLKAYFTPNTEVEATWDITFTRTSTTEATATVTSKGAAVEGVTATIAIAGGDNPAYQNQNQTASNTGILCINRNTNAATAENPNAYTLTITNNSDKNFVFDYAAVAGVALNSEGGYQPSGTPRDRMFALTCGESSLTAEQLSICDNNHCSGKETFHAFAQPITVAAGQSYTIAVAIYNFATADSQEKAKGCFYGLTRIALGGTTVTIGSTGYTTLYTPIAMTVPEGVDIYKGAFDAEESVLTLTAIGAGTAIPHETAVIIEGEPGSEFGYEVAARNATKVAGNDLKGTHAAVATSTVITDTQEPYTLQRSNDNEEEVVFKRFVGETLAGGKAYLMLPKSLATQQQAVRIRKYKTPTEIESVETTDNGQQTADFFDLAGRRVLNPTKGVYIVNGKKVVIK